MTVHLLRYKRWYFLQVLRILDSFYKNPSQTIYSSYFFNFFDDKAIAAKSDPCYQQILMGNQHCCDDRQKGGDWNQNKGTKRELQKLDNSYVNKSLGKPTGGQIKLVKNGDLKATTTQGSLPASKQNVEEKKEKQKDESSLNLSRSGINEKQKIESNNKQTKLSSKKDINIELSNSVSEEKDENPQSTSILKTIPQLTAPVKKTYQQQNYFDFQVQHKPIVEYYGGQIYEGEMALGMPNGFGKFYKKDDSFYVGYFKNGKAQGLGAFIFPDGSYFKGQFQENKAECIDGKYHSKQLDYQGGFKGNVFHGKGEEKGPRHAFKGEYSNGVKASGALTWQQNNSKFTYEGTFNENGLFHGKGRMEEPTGVYDGKFQNGYKHGSGSYRFMNQIVYEGQYQFSRREGQGKLINPGNKVAYEGNFKDGLPHGAGFITDNNGEKQEGTWIMGIDRDIL